MVKLLRNQLLVEKVKQTQTGKIQIPTTGMKSVKAKVIASGPGFYQNGVLIENEVQVDDIIMYSGEGIEVMVEDKMYQLVGEHDVYFVLESEGE